MTEHSIALLVCLGVIVVLAALLYATGRRYISTLSASSDLRGLMIQILSYAQNADDSLRQQRRVLYDAHKRICAVTKGVEKPPS